MVPRLNDEGTVIRAAPLVTRLVTVCGFARSADLPCAGYGKQVKKLAACDNFDGNRAPEGKS